MQFKTILMISISVIAGSAVAGDGKTLFYVPPLRKKNHVTTFSKSTPQERLFNDKDKEVVYDFSHLPWRGTQAGIVHEGGQWYSFGPDRVKIGYMEGNPLAHWVNGSAAGYALGDAHATAGRKAQQLKAYATYHKQFPRVRNAGLAVLLAGLLAELLLYRSYKKQPKRIQEAEEKLRQAVEELDGSHPLHFFDWTVEGDELYKRVVYLLDEYDDGVPKNVEVALKQYRDAYEGPSTLRHGVTHGLTLAGLLATLYGGINQKRLADYTKGMPAVGRTGGRTLGR